MATRLVLQECHLSYAGTFPFPIEKDDANSRLLYWLTSEQGFCNTLRCDAVQALPHLAITSRCASSGEREDIVQNGTIDTRAILYNSLLMA